VVQSHRQPLPASWFSRCVESVRNWAGQQGFDYRWLGDELFDPLNPLIREKTRGQIMVAADLARLHILSQSLEAGYDQAVWVDADVLVLQPDELAVPECGAVFGREVWIQADEGGALRVHRKIHNAFMAFAADDPVLPFYLYSAQRIVSRYDGSMAPQTIGPKLLTFLHNVIGFDVLETAGMLSPAVARDVLAGQGEALDRFNAESVCAPLALNLCGSSVTGGELSDFEMEAVIDTLSSALSVSLFRPIV